MTTIRLLGGLGNQLFQIAAGQWLTDVRHQRVRWDTSWFSAGRGADTVRHFEVGQLLEHREQRRVPTAAARLIYSSRNPLHVREHGPEVELLDRVGPHSWLEGYFQRYRYADECIDGLRGRLLPVL